MAPREPPDFSNSEDVPTDDAVAGVRVPPPQRGEVRADEVAGAAADRNSQVRKTDKPSPRNPGKKLVRVGGGVGSRRGEYPNTEERRIYMRNKMRERRARAKREKEKASGKETGPGTKTDG